MKKLFSLTLALLMLLCVLAPALAEETVITELPDLNLPMTADEYKAAYEAIVTANAPTCQVTWLPVEQDGGTVWIATIDNSFTSLMFLVQGEHVAEIACIMQSELSEDMLLTFLSMGGYGGAALMLDEDTSAAEASAAFMLEMANVFSAISQGIQPEDIGGLPGGINISPLESGAYQYYFVLRLTPVEAEAAAE